MSETLRLLLIWLGTVSILSFLLFGWDKLMAKLGRSRIPEAALLGAALLGGGAGALLGMLLYDGVALTAETGLRLGVMLGGGLLAGGLRATGGGHRKRRRGAVRRK